MFAKAERGEVSKADAVGRARASKDKDLPEKVEKKASFADALLKLATEHKDPSLGQDIVHGGAVGGGVGAAAGIAAGGPLGGAVGAIAPDLRRIRLGPSSGIARRAGSRLPKRIPVSAGERALSTAMGAGIGAAAIAPRVALLGLGAGAGIGAVRHLLRHEKPQE